MMHDPLAYEIRRLSQMLLCHNADNRDATQTSSQTVPPGDLALRIASTFDLRGVDVDLAIAVLAGEIDHEFGALLYSIVSRTEQGVLAALLPRLEDRLAVLDAVGQDAPVLRAGLLRRSEQDGVGTLSTTRRFRATVAGFPLLAMLPEFAWLVETAPLPVPWVVPPAGLIEVMTHASQAAMCVISGAPGVGKSSWARHAAYSVGGRYLDIDVARAARAGRDVLQEIRELLVDAALQRVPVVLDNAGEMLTNESRLSLLIEDLLDMTDGRFFVVVGDAEHITNRLASRALSQVRMGPPPPAARRDLWQRAPMDARTRQTLADDLVLTPRQIDHAITLIESGVEPAIAAFEQLPKAHNLTLPNKSRVKLEALVLPEDTRREVEELICAIRARGHVVSRLAQGRGHAITALFNGESGTGKTFACEVIAAEVGLPLLRVNVASLVDKYIGETEKNLERVFAQAQAQGGILFFDEADALFGARTDVSRAQDRYANLETNLLLQLMESFSGIVLLTTNLKQNIDQAFLRRIMFKVYFETPEPKERERLWRSVMPAADFAPDIDFARLARSFELAGGSIRAAALRAAYRAAAASTPIQMADLIECAQLETQGMGRVATWK